MRFFCAVLAFSLNTCAYTVELLAGAIRDTNPGEVEAAQAMGLSRLQILRRIVLPLCDAPHLACLLERGHHDAAQHLAGQYRPSGL